MSLQLTIDYPENLPLALQKTREEFEREAKWAMAVKLFEMKRISSGIAANLLLSGQGDFFAEAIGLRSRDDRFERGRIIIGSRKCLKNTCLLTYRKWWVTTDC